MTPHLEFLLITKSPQVAVFAEECGVDNIFLDLEFLGKEERQGHTNLLISRHTWDDVAAIRNVIRKANLLVRIDQPHEGTTEQVHRALDLGADRIMLPMFTRASEIEIVNAALGGRKMLVPLVETMQALVRFEEYADFPCIDRCHLGLNDIQLQCGLSFLFEGMTGGLAELFANKCKAAHIPFGIGGVARLNSQNALPAERILGEHARLGSSAVILSRAFHGGCDDMEAFTGIDLKAELQAIRDFYASQYSRTAEEVEENRVATQAIVKQIANPTLRKAQISVADQTLVESRSS